MKSKFCFININVDNGDGTATAHELVGLLNEEWRIIQATATSGSVQYILERKEEHDKV